MDAISMSRVWREPARLMVFLGVMLIAPSGWALDVPPLTGRVVDLAHVLPADVAAALTRDLEAHEMKTSNQVAVTLDCRHERNHPLLTSLLALRGFIIGSFAFSSDDTHLLRSLSQFFLIAHHRYVSIICSIRWFENYS